MYPAGMNFLEPCRGTRTHTPGYMPLWDVTSPVESRRRDSKVSSGPTPTRKLIHRAILLFFFCPPPFLPFLSLPERNAFYEFEILRKNSEEKFYKFEIFVNNILYVDEIFYERRGEQRERKERRK